MAEHLSEDAEAQARDALLRRERIPATLINVVLSIGFFLLVFGWAPAAAGYLAADFVPQTLGITLLGGVVPALVMRRRIRRGAIVPAGPEPTLAALLGRIALFALAAVVVGAGAAAILLLLLAPEIIQPAPALLLKAAYGGLLGLTMTPPVLRTVLGMPAWPRARRGRAGLTANPPS